MRDTIPKTNSQSWHSTMKKSKLNFSQGFFDKCIERANNTSAICSAHTGEEIRDSTVGKGK